MSSLCFDARDDTRLARGWPHCVELAIGHAHDKRPARSAVSLALTNGPKYYTLWPREVTHRFLRAMAVLRLDRDRLRGTIGRNARAALAREGAPTHDESKTWLTEATAGWAYFESSRTREFVFAIEALIGADDALDAIATGFENATLRMNRRGNMIYEQTFKAAIALATPFVGIRASKPAWAKYVSRIDEQRRRFDKPGWQGCVEAFDIVVGGASFIRRTFKPTPIWIDYVDDPAWVLAALEDNATVSCSVRAVAIAGLGAMKGLSRRKFAPPSLPSVMRDFGMIRSPEAVTFALSIVGRSSAKDTPLRWLVAHGDYAHDIVEAAAARGPHASIAKSVLRAITNR